MTHRSPPVLFVAAVLASAAACAQSGPSPSAAATASASARAPAPADLLATVNGAPIGRFDVSLKMKADSHETEMTPLRTKNVLEAVIRQELAAQRAVELGLQTDAKYQEALRQMEAQMNTFKRKELAEVFYRNEVEKKAQVGEDEARKYFDANAARIRTQVEVSQILQRNEAAIEKVREELDHGASFEEVAGRRLPTPADAARKPWELGYLSWQQVPEPWRSVVYDMKPGQVSKVIKGRNERYWIIKLVDRREDQAVTFESAKAAIVADLKSSKMDELRDKMDQELRAKARIEYATPRAEMEE